MINGRAEQLFHAIFNCEDGLVELRALPSKDRIFVPQGNIEAVNEFIKNHRQEDLYWGVAVRRDSTSGALKNCLHLTTLFVDLDFKAFPSAEAAREKLQQFPLQPSYIVNSGGGLHCYWLLTDPIDLQTRAADAKDLLRRLARAIGGDMDAAEPARVLRIPGTFNYKYNPPRLVTLE